MAGCTNFHNIEYNTLMEKHQVKRFYEGNQKFDGPDGDVVMGLNVYKKP